MKKCIKEYVSRGYLIRDIVCLISILIGAAAGIFYASTPLFINDCLR